MDCFTNSNQTETWSEFERLICQNEPPDAAFIIKNETAQCEIVLQCHKAVISANSPELFTKLLQENPAKLENCDEKVFKCILRYFYTRQISFDSENILHIILMSRKFGVINIEKAAVQFAMNAINAENCVKYRFEAKHLDIMDLEAICIVEVSKLICDIVSRRDIDQFWSFCDSHKFYDSQYPDLNLNLHHYCIRFIDRYPDAIIAHPRALQLSADEVQDIISYPSFKVMKEQVIGFIKKWIETNSQVDYKSILEAVHLETFSEEEIFRIVRPSGLFTDTAIVEALYKMKKKENECKELRNAHGPLTIEPIRYLFDVNFAASYYNPKLVSGKFDNLT